MSPLEHELLAMIERLLRDARPMNWADTEDPAESAAWRDAADLCAACAITRRASEQRGAALAALRRSLRTSCA